MTSFQRTNGRAADALRPVSITRHYTRHAEGSVLVCFGDTKVLCTASVEEKVPPLQARLRRGLGHGRIRHAAARHPHPQRPRGRQGQAERPHAGDPAPDRALDARVFDLKALGERTISLDCDVLQADGGTRTAAITGAFVAAHDAVSWLLAGKKIAASPIRDLRRRGVGGHRRGHAAARPRIRRGLGLRHRHERGDDLRRLRRGAGHGRGRALHARRDGQLLALADKGIRELVAAQKAALVPSEPMRPCSPPTTPRSCRAEAAVRAAAAGAGRAGPLGVGRGRGAAPHLHRERAGQGAPCARHRRRGDLADDSGLCVDALGGRPAWCRRTSPRVVLPEGERRRTARVQDEANNALLLERLQGQPTAAPVRLTLVAIRSPTIPSRWSPWAAGRARSSRRRAVPAVSATTR